MRQIDFVKRLKERLNIEFQKQDRSGVYGYTQRHMAYNSNRIEGSTLTEKQTASIFESGTVYSDDTDTIFRTKDIEEMTGHFKMFNYMLRHCEEPLSEEIICSMHRNLKEGVFEDLANGYAIGAYKARANRVADITTALPQEVPACMKELLQEYHAKLDIQLKDIAELHAKFESIHPFQDGNGRVGRMMIVKECLAHNIIPVIIQDDNKAAYMRHLNTAQTKQNYRGLASYFREEQQRYLEETLPLLFDYDQVPEVILPETEKEKSL